MVNWALNNLSSSSSTSSSSSSFASSCRSLITRTDRSVWRIELSSAVSAEDRI